LKTITTFLIALLFGLHAKGQSNLSYSNRLGTAMSIDSASTKGISIEQLDLEYKSALDTDSTKAVFRSEQEQAQLQKAYIQLLQDLSTFLKQHDFKWEKATKCFQRIYFSTDGKIDYFIYNFKLKSVAAADLISDKRAAKFDELLGLFIKDYTFAVKANEKFAQCSPTAFH
jgi:hypothetical protein